MSDKPADRFFEILVEIIRPRRAAVKTPFSIAFAVVDAGGYVLDTRRPELVTNRYEKDCDVAILTNTMTLFDIAAGNFDFDALKPHQLFDWGGSTDALEALRDLLSGGQSALATRIAALKR